MDKLIENDQFLVLLTSHQRRLLGYVRALVPNRADAEEVLQEVSLYIWQHADEFQPGTDFAAWAMRIAHFRVLKLRDSRSRARLVFDDSLLERLAIEAQSLDCQDDRRQEALENCLKKLPKHEHQLVTQFYGESGATPQSVAKRIGRSVKGVYVSVHRIRVKLFDCVRRTLAAEDHAL